MSKRGLSRLIVPGLALFLSGCLGSRSGPVALSSPPTPLAGSDEARAGTLDGVVRATPRFNGQDIKTVKSGSPSDPAAIVPAERDPDTIVSSAEPLPTASQIFDFHPPGSKPDSWRQPFDFTDNDGPLVAYRDHTAAMLKQLKDPRFEQGLPATPPKTTGDPAQ